MELLRALASRQVFAGCVALVCAHPDDEAIAAGGSLSLLPHLLLVTVTDGAPHRLDDWRKRGFANPQAYAAARAAELHAAFAAVGCTAPHVSLGYPDQDASFHLAAIARRLAALFAEHRIEIVLTHAYEGGHPDHDATAWAVHAAARHCTPPPAIAEFPSYHAALGQPVRGQFLPGPEPVLVHLDEAAQARKTAMLAAHRSQAEVLRDFTTERESFRTAPAYDWSQPPHPGALGYEGWLHDMTGERWRALAAEASWD